MSKDRISFFNELLAKKINPTEQALVANIKMNIKAAYESYVAAGPTELTETSVLPALLRLGELSGNAQSKEELIFYTVTLGQVLQLLGSRHSDVVGVDELVEDLLKMTAKLRRNGKEDAFINYQSKVNARLEKFKEKLNQLSKMMLDESKNHRHKAHHDSTLRLSSSYQTIQMLIKQVDAIKKDLAVEDQAVDKMEAGINKLRSIAVAKIVDPDSKITAVNGTASILGQHNLLKLFELRYSQLPFLNTTQEDILTAVGAILGGITPLGELGKTIETIIFSADSIFSASMHVKDITPHVKKNPAVGAALAVGLGGMVTCAILLPVTIPIFLKLIEAIGFAGLQKDIASNILTVIENTKNLENLNAISGTIEEFFHIIKRDVEKMMLTIEHDDEKIIRQARLLTASQAFFDDKAITNLDEARKILIDQLDSSGIDGSAFDRILFAGDDYDHIYSAFILLARRHSTPKAFADFIVTMIETPLARRTEILKPLLGDQVSKPLIADLSSRFSKIASKENFKEISPISPRGQDRLPILASLLNF